MSELDKAGTPAKAYDYRAWHPRTRDVIMLEDPSYIRFHDGYQLQKRDDNGAWVYSPSTPEDDAHPEDEGQ